MENTKNVKMFVFGLVLLLAITLGFGFLPSEDTQGKLRNMQGYTTTDDYTATDDFIPPFPYEKNQIRILPGDRLNKSNDFIPPFPVRSSYGASDGMIMQRNSFSGTGTANLEKIRAGQGNDLSIIPFLKSDYTVTDDLIGGMGNDI